MGALLHLVQKARAAATEETQWPILEFIVDGGVVGDAAALARAEAESARLIAQARAEGRLRPLGAPAPRGLHIEAIVRVIVDPVREAQ